MKAIPRPAGREARVVLSPICRRAVAAAIAVELHWTELGAGPWHPVRAPTLRRRLPKPDR